MQLPAPDPRPRGGASLTGLTALLLHDRDYLRLQRCVEKKLRSDKGGRSEDVVVVWWNGAG